MKWLGAIEIVFSSLPSRISHHNVLQYPLKRKMVHEFNRAEMEWLPSAICIQIRTA